MINLSDQRFTVVGADTMLALIGLMNQHAHPLARIVYFGPNHGDYSDQDKYKDNARMALFIAVFDYAPAMVYPVEDLELDALNDTLTDVSPNDKITMSA